MKRKPTRSVAGSAAAPGGVAGLRALVDSFAGHFPGHTMQRMRTPDGRYRYTYVSPGMRETFGLNPEAILSQASVTHDWLPPGDRERFIAALERSARTLDTLDEEVRVQHPDGGIRWVRSIGHPRRLPDGTVIWDGVALDVTDRHEAREALDRALAAARLRETSGARMATIAVGEFAPHMSNLKAALAALGRHLPSGRGRKQFAAVEAGLADLDHALTAAFALLRASGADSAQSRPVSAPTGAHADALTGRQRQILDLIKDGCSNLEIASRLGITEGTAKLHVSAMLKRLGVRNRTEAAILARQ
jgi:PAS domain S-box-containing protein